MFVCGLFFMESYSIKHTLRVKMRILFYVWKI